MEEEKKEIEKETAVEVEARATTEKVIAKKREAYEAIANPVEEEK
jgi:hypothetical protein